MALAYLTWRSARGARMRAGLPKGQVIYADTGAWTRCPPLRAPRYGLSGKPDYMLRVGRQTVPVEAKPSRRAPEPYEADIMQLAAYCLLVEETSGQRPPYGLLHYADHTFRIPYTPALRASLLGLLDDMRADMDQADVPRTHDDPQRCRFCGQRAHCDVSLVD